MIQDRLKIKDSSVISVFWLKNRHNTANGDFDWGWDGGDLIQKHLLKSLARTLAVTVLSAKSKSNYLRIYMHFSIYSHY